MAGDLEGITYWAVDKTGHRHGRYYQKHTTPIYKLALIRRTGTDEQGACAMYANEGEARTAFEQCREGWKTWNAVKVYGGKVGDPMYPDAALVPVWWYRGR